MNSRQRTFAVGFVAVALLFCCLNSSGCFSSPAVVGDSELSTRAELYADGAERVHRVLTAVLKEADSKTSLVADHFHGEEGSSKNPISKKLKRLNYNRYSPHNSAADLYPFLVLGAHFTEPGLLRGRLLEMLRNEVKYTSSKLSIPGNFDLKTGRLYRSSLFGAAEYAKDGLYSPITELLGRTAWFYRMYELMVDVMEVAPFKSDFGMLPGRDTELNGDMLQVLFRLALMTGEERFADWARRIADAYIFEVLPQSNGLPVQEWSFKQHRGHKKVQLRDHGNETVVGLALVYAYEKLKKPERASRYEPVLRQMFERLLESTNPDGFFYNSISCDTLQPVDSNLADSWGYVYSAIYNFYLLTNETRYRDAVLRVLRNLPKYEITSGRESTMTGLLIP